MRKDAFLKKVWEWKAQSGGAIIDQLKRLGSSVDWSRERFTMDEHANLCMTKAFIILYRDSLFIKTNAWLIGTQNTKQPFLMWK